MKKIVSSFIMGCSLLVGLNSCSLDETPIDQITEKEAYSTPMLIYLNAVAGIYGEVGADGGGSGLGGTDRGLYDLNVFTTDEAVLPTRGSDWYDGGLWQNVYQHKWTSTTDLMQGSWGYLYRAVGKCNQSIDKLNEILQEDPNNEAIPLYIGEVRALRAMFYYYLLDNFARVPIVTSSKTLIKDVTQSDRSKVYEFVVKELQEVTPLLADGKSASQGAYYGRMTKSVGHFILAKLALNAQVYADDNWADNNGTPDGATTFKINGTEVGAWQATIAYCDSIKQSGYTLNSSFSANFSVTNEGSVENIFVIPMDPILYKARNMYNVRTRHYAHGKAWNGQDGWNGACATTDLLKVFREVSVDPRLAMSFITGVAKAADGSDVMDGRAVLEYKPDAVKLITTGAFTEKTAGARWGKYEFDRAALSGGQLVHNDYVLYRYADVLLMKAEAMTRAGQNANSILAEVRKRVGAADRTATLDNILKERMLELSWEGFRRQDLIRFGMYNKDVMDRTGSEPFRKVFPIPSSVLDNNTNLSQNIGYN